MMVVAARTRYKPAADPRPKPHAPLAMRRDKFLIDSSTISKRRKSRHCTRSDFLIDSDLAT